MIANMTISLYSQVWVKCPHWILLEPLDFPLLKMAMITLFGKCLLAFLWPLLLPVLLSHFNCVRLCDPRDSSPPGSPVPGILQARTLEWVAISFSNAWKWKVKMKSLRHVRLFATPWTAAYQAPLSMGFSRQEYWSGMPLPSLRICAITYLITKFRK